MIKDFRNTLKQVHFLERKEAVRITGLTIASIASISCAIFFVDTILTNLYNLLML